MPHSIPGCAVRSNRAGITNPAIVMKCAGAERDWADFG